MKILCAGMRRSGSTWMYNAVRLICEQHGSVYRCFGDYHDLPKDGEYDYVVRKAHEYRDKWRKWADVIVTSHRDIRDVAASAMRRGLWRRRKGVVDHLQRAVKREHGRWAPIADRDMCYERMLDNPAREIEALADVLGWLPCDTAKVLKELDELRPPSTGVDQVTQMNANHITTDGRHGRYTDTLTRSQIEQIEQHFGQWLRDHGYRTTG